MTTSAYSPGLEGVIGGRTAICTIDEAGLSYRGYPIQDLAERATFEEVAHLLLVGELPNPRQLAAFREQLRSEREVPSEIRETFRRLPAGANGMDAIRSGVSLLALWDPEVGDNSHAANQRKAVRLLAKIPTLIALLQVNATGTPAPEPRSDFSHAAHLLHAITGRVPDEMEERIFDLSLILYAEHELNASTFAARVTVSTLADLHAGVTSAIGALKGPLHGGANESAMATMLVIGEPDRAEEWLLAALARKERVMGFGHRVLRQGDLRARILAEWGRRLAEQKGDSRWSRMAEIMEPVMEREKGLRPNVDFPCGWVYTLLGLPVNLYTPIFVASRTSGWAAHVIEQLDDNRLIRPRSEYTGPAPGRVFVPLAARP